MDPKEFVLALQRSGMDDGPVRKGASEWVKRWVDATKEAYKDVGSTAVHPILQAIKAWESRNKPEVSSVPEAIPIPSTAYPTKGLPVAQVSPSHKGEKPVRKGAMVAISPSTETHDFTQAQSSLTSQNQQQLRGIAKQLFTQLGIKKGQLLNAIGDTSAWGAEPSVAGHINEDIDPARLKYLAAWLGNRYNQKNVLTFLGHSGGKDLLHDLTVGDTDLEGIRKSLTTHGLDYRTLIPDRHQTRIMMFDEGGKLQNNVKTFAETHRAQIHSTPGTGEFVGDPAWTSRPRAREQYRKVIGEFESSQGGGDPSGPAGRSATNSPSGGSVIRGQFYPGGQRLPNPY